MTLNQIVAKGYAALAMGRGSLGAPLKEFLRAAQDPSFVAAAREELARLESVPAGRCAASRISAQFLQIALQQFDAQEE